MIDSISGTPTYSTIHLLPRVGFLRLSRGDTRYTTSTYSSQLILAQMSPAFLSEGRSISFYVRCDKEGVRGANDAKFCLLAEFLVTSSPPLCGITQVDRSSTFAFEKWKRAVSGVRPEHKR